MYDEQDHQADKIIVRQPCDKAVIDLQCACIHYGFCFCIKVHHMNHMDIHSAVSRGFAEVLCCMLYICIHIITIETR